MSAHWAELDRIFAEAREMPLAEQAAYLARACGSNAALRIEAESLLSASNLTGEFMARPAIDRLAQSLAGDGLDLKSGRRIGAYALVQKLGSGGAGEVWRAKDERLGRDVAIKFLLPHLSGDAEKLRRFAEEARAASTLNHPNILIVHDIGEQEGMPYLVAECLEGRSLRERLKAGPMAVSEAVSVAQGMAQGLAAAHERGIVHRDLKPENTFLKSDGGIKLLDFGLAKLKLPAASPVTPVDDGVLSLVAGTAAYMAPEQARGEAPDPRSDLFALGVMMYEMLGGQHPFRGASVFETLNAILTRDAAELQELNDRVSPALARIVMRLLQKSPDARFQSARDLSWSLSQASERPAPQPVATARRSAWLRFAVPVALAAALATGWWISGLFQDAPADGELTRFTWKLPTGSRLDSAPIVAPDGRRIAYTVSGADGVRLHVRSLDSLEPRAIEGNNDVISPFWSPDGRTLAYFTEGKLMKVSLPNGAPAELASAPYGRGGTWSSSGVIVYAPDVILSGLSRMPAEGGAPEPATLLDPSRGETSHWWPVALPDGVHFLFFVRSIDAERRGVYLARIDRPAAQAGRRLFYAESGVAYLPRAGSRDADLVYLVDGHVEARRFDTTSLEAAPNARTLDFLPAEFTLNGPVMVTASEGVMAYTESAVPSGNRLSSITLDGKDPRSWPVALAHNFPRVSPDGKLIARLRLDETFSQPDMIVEDLERGTVYPVLKTLEPDMSPVWSPDGRQLAFVTGHLPGRQGNLVLNIVAADGTGVVRTFPCPGDYCEPTDWSADGSTLLLTVLESGNSNVWTLPAMPGGEAQPLVTAAYDEREARFSPDGRWIAYVSEEAGRPEVLVHSLAGSSRRYTVSGAGGTQPVWRRDGKELYFANLQGQLHRVAVIWAGNGDPQFGLPTNPGLPRVGFGHWGTQYDVAPDGSRIYFMQPTDEPLPQAIQVAINWRSLLD